MLPKSLPRFRDLADLNSPVGKLIVAIAIRGEATAAELVQDTGMSRSSISGMLTELRQTEAVLDQMRPKKGMGRPTLVHSLNPRIGVFAGALLGLGEIQVTICDASREQLYHRLIELPVDYTPETAAQLVKESLDLAFQSLSFDESDLVGLGLAVSAPVTADGTVLYGSVLTKWMGVKLGEVFPKYIDCPLFVANESNCGALYEMSWGAAKGETDFVMFKFDLGTGGAIISNGQVQMGHSGYGARLGHITIDRHGPTCRCGSRGCLDVYAGGNQLMSDVARSKGYRHALFDFVDQARFGNEDNRQKIETAGHFAGIGLAIVDAVLNPQMFLITGGLVLAGDIFLKPLRAAFEDYSMSEKFLLPEGGRVRILAGSVPANDHVLGAAALVLRQVGRIA